VSTRLSVFFLLLLSVGYAVLLAWQEWRFRLGLAAPAPVVATVAAPVVRAPLDTTAVITVLGLTAQAPLRPSAEPLTLQASFVLDNGLSRALLADAQGARMYQVGDQLPGGSVLRRVEANQAVLWNKGREEVLTLQTSAARFLQRFDGQTEAAPPAISTRYLRPHAGQPE
jgi:hypothetical protein